MSVPDTEEYFVKRLMEQAAAIIDRGSKALLHGADTLVPHQPTASNVTNGRRLVIELNGLLAVMDAAQEAGMTVYDEGVRKTKQKSFKQRTTAHTRKRTD